MTATRQPGRTVRPGSRGAMTRASWVVRCLAVAVVGLVVVGDSRQPAWTDVPDRLVNQATVAQEKATRDEFGIDYLSPTRPGGTYWVSSWDSSRQFDGVDPADEWFDAAHGEGSFEAGDGQLVISGQTPRMYVHDPQMERQWRDVEITMYVKRGQDDGIPYSGFTAVARSNHLTTEDGSSDRCDTRGYGGRLRFDGHVDFEKETAHPHNQATSNRTVFPNGMPTGVWLGVKYVVFDQDDGVHLQMWLDLTDGRGGGDWRLINEVIDHGHLFGDVPCATGIDPAMALDNDSSRKGSESGKPNVSVYFRGDGIGDGGLSYKWGSVREITP